MKTRGVTLQQCSNNKDICERSQECPHLSHLSLWKRTSDSSRCHKQNRKTPGSATTNSYFVTFIYSECNVPWGGPMFQCQELGHITCHCPNVCCFECEEYGHIVVDCPYWTHPQAHLPVIIDRIFNTRYCTRSYSRHHQKDRCRHSRSRLQSHPHRYWSHSHHNSHRSHSRSHHRDSRCHHRGTLWCHHPSAYCFCCDTPHQRSSSQRSSSTHPKDCSRSWLCSAYKASKKLCINLHPILAELQLDLKIGDTPRSW